jgi:hypothetical protein
MNRSHSLAKALVAATGLFVASLSAQAVSIVNITVSGGSLVESAPQSDLPSFGDADVLAWLKADVIAYNGLQSTSLPQPVANNPLPKTDTPSKPTDLNLVLDNSYDYLFLHWGGPGGGVVQAFYLGGYNGSFDFTLPSTGANSLSSYTLYGPNGVTTHDTRVPDGGNTLMMFGLVCIGAFFARNFVAVRARR